MHKFLLCLLTPLSLFTAYSEVSATTGEEERISAVIELQDSDIASLKQTGFFKMQIPLSYRDRIASVTLKRPVRFKDESAIVFNDVDRRAGTVAIRVDDSTIEQIDYQPVELKFYESGYQNIVVRYQPGNAAFLKSVNKDDSDVFVTTLNNSKSIAGRMAGMKGFALKSELGKVKVDLSKVSEITFDEEGKATVQLMTGDQLSGAINFKDITINSRWGKEDLKIADIARISRSYDDSAATMMGQPGMISESPVMPTDNHLLGGQPIMSYPQPTQPVPMPTQPMPMPMQPMPMPMQPMQMPVEMAMPVNASPLQSFSYPVENTYDSNGQRIDVVPRPLDQPAMPAESFEQPPAFDQNFDQSFEQAMQPIDPSMQPINSFPMDSSQFGPFFGEPIQMGQPSVEGSGEFNQGLPFNNGMSPPLYNQEPAPVNNDFWFFPQ